MLQQIALSLYNIYAVYEKEYRVIVAHGFLPSEAKQFVEAKAPDGTPQDFSAVFNSDVFQKTLKSRLQWVSRLKAQGYSAEQTAWAIQHFYKLEGFERTVWAFVKAEYEKADRPPTDYEFATRTEARTRIQRMSVPFGKRYHRPMDKSWRPLEPPNPGPPQLPLKPAG